jgi:hypothetical protein
MFRRTSRARAVTAWSAALLQLLVCVGFASDVVLCVAADGHISLEVQHVAGPCLTDYARHHPGAETEFGFSRLDVVDIEHHGCRDTLLSQPAARRNDETAGAGTLGPPAVAVLSPVPPPPAGSRPALVAEPSRVAADRLGRLRTVVLLV